jgi:alpha-L-fucosidase
VDIVWFDGLGGKAKDWDAENLFTMIRALQPHVIINNRAGLPGDFSTPEQRVGYYQPHRAWESCITIGGQWAFKPDDPIKSLKTCIQTLVKCVGGDGNLLLNVGPMPTGQIEPRQVARLEEMGNWLQACGESIYGTRGGPFHPGAWGVSTHRGDTVYLHILDWEWMGDRVVLPAIEKRIVASSVLTGGKATVDQAEDAIGISMSPSDRNEIDTIVVLTLDGEAAQANPKEVSSGSVAVGRKARASNVLGNQSTFAPAKAFDDDDATRWATDTGVLPVWLEVDLQGPTTIDRAIIRELGDRTRQFELQCRNNEADDFRTFASGTTIGEDLRLRFQPVMARFIRLNIPKAIAGPTILELQLFAPNP